MSKPSWGFFNTVEHRKPLFYWATCYAFVSFESRIEL